MSVLVIFKIKIFIQSKIFKIPYNEEKCDFEGVLFRNVLAAFY